MRLLTIPAFLIPAALGVTPLAGTWENAGAISTSCIASVSESGGRLSGTVKCPKLSRVMPLDGPITSSDLNGSSQDSVAWTAQRDGDRYVGQLHVASRPLHLGGDAKVRARQPEMSVNADAPARIRRES